MFDTLFYHRIVLVTKISFQAENEKEQCSTCVIVFLSIIVLTSIVEIKNALSEIAVTFISD